MPGPAAFSTTRERASISPDPTPSRMRAPVTRPASRKEARNPGVVRDHRPRVGRCAHEGHREPLAARDLRIGPESSAGQSPGRNAGKQGQDPRWREAASRRDPTVRRQSMVAAEAHEVVDPEAQGQRLPALRAVAVGRHDEGQGADDLGRDLEERGTLPDRFAHASHVEGLEISQAAVDRLEAVPGGPGAEVLGLDERRGETALGGIPGRRRAVDPSAHDQHVELPRRERAQVPLHRHSYPVGDDSTGPARSAGKAGLATRFTRNGGPRWG